MVLTGILRFFFAFCPVFCSCGNNLLDIGCFSAKFNL